MKRSAVDSAPPFTDCKHCNEIRGRHASEESALDPCIRRPKIFSPSVVSHRHNIGIDETGATSGRTVVTDYTFDTRANVHFAVMWPWATRKLVCSCCAHFYATRDGHIRAETAIRAYTYRRSFMISAWLRHRRRRADHSRRLRKLRRR